VFTEVVVVLGMVEAGVVEAGAMLGMEGTGQVELTGGWGLSELMWEGGFRS